MAEAELDTTETLSAIAALVAQAQESGALLTFLDSQKFRHIGEPVSYSPETGVLEVLSSVTQTTEQFGALDLSEIRVVSDIS